MYLALY